MEKLIGYMFSMDSHAVDTNGTESVLIRDPMEDTREGSLLNTLKFGLQVLSLVTHSGNLGMHNLTKV